MAETKTQAAEPKKSGWMTKLFGFDPSTMKVSTEIVAGITTFLDVLHPRRQPFNPG